MTLHYRADIDGLRAVAVAGVVLYHAGVPGLSGGFVGVDVFFVISGFLITGILAEDVRRDRFSILRFYDRRLRRILPALVAMLAAATFAALVMLPPGELLAYGRTLVATVSFWSNIQFWLDTDYFGAPAATLPLLHTWSLAVEEQFYLVWPVLIAVLLRRRPDRAVGVLGGLALASLALAQWQLSHQPEAAFYLLPARACELAIGAICALLPAPARGRLAREMAGLAGLGAILVAMVWLDVGSPFPGVAALLPCLGTAAVILSGPDTAASRLLGRRPMVALGLVSYSLYLWHWPILVFGDLALDRPRTPAETVASVAVAVLLAALSWRFVERPFRRHPGQTLRLGGMAVPRSIPVGIIVLAVSAAGADALVRFKGFPERRPDVTAAEAKLRDHDPLNLGKACLDAAENAHQEDCVYGAGKARVFAWGDSHVGAIAPMLRVIGEHQGFSVLQWGQSGCPPLLGVDLVRNARIDSLCRRANDDAFASLERRPDIRTVVLAARWSLYAETRRAPAESNETAYLFDEKRDVRSVDNSGRVLAAGLARTLAKLTATGRQVLIVQQAPEFANDPGQCALDALWWRRPANCQQPEAQALDRLAASRQIITAAAEANRNVSVFDPVAHLCEGEVCSAVHDGVPFYRDFDHLTRAGAEWLASYVSWPGQGSQSRL